MCVQMGERGSNALTLEGDTVAPSSEKPPSERFPAVRRMARGTAVSKPWGVAQIRRDFSAGRVSARGNRKCSSGGGEVPSPRR